MKNIKNALKVIFDPFSMEFEDSINWIDSYIIEYLQINECSLRLPLDYELSINKILEYQELKYALFTDKNGSNIFVTKNESSYKVISQDYILEINNTKKCIFFDYRIKTGYIKIESSYLGESSKIDKSRIYFWTNEELDKSDDESTQIILPKRIIILKSDIAENLHNNYYDINMILSYLGMEDSIENKDSGKIKNKIATWFKRNKNNIR